MTQAFERSAGASLERRSAATVVSLPSRPHPEHDRRGGGRPLFDGVFLGGFECSCQQLEDGRRLDLLASTRHVELVDADYARLRAIGMTACRDGMPWAAVERGGSYDFAPYAKMLRAADRHDLTVAWDLMHFGWPDGVDPFSAAFPVRFGKYAAAFARFYAAETDRLPIVAPVNEMSFLAWAGGDVRCMNPFEAARGVELKAQLVRASIEAIEAVRAVLPHARLLQPEPIINIVKSPEHPLTWRRVESDNLLMYQAWDMLTGRVWPSLGGQESYLDIVGINYYSNNQFTIDGTTIRQGDIRYKPLSKMLVEVWERYGRPMIIAETGAEGDDRAPWLRYVSGQCVHALQHGCELHGITLYPIVNHPGWVDERHCHNGLWDYANEAGEREADPALLAEIERQAPRLEAARAARFAGADSAELELRASEG